VRDIVVTVGFCLIVVGVLIAAALAGRSGSTTAVIRLDHFLPFLRKKKKNESLRPPSTALRLAKRFLPAALFADPITGKAGLARRALKRIGPTALSSPVRRIIQTVCFVAFLWLFFYVLWPYDAQPQPAPAASMGWRVEQIEPQTGYLHLSGSEEIPWNVQPGQSLYLADEAATDPVRGDVGQFTIVAIEPGRIVLAPARPLSDEQIDTFLTGGGSWSLLADSPWPSHYADNLRAKETLPADTFLVIDPLVSLSTRSRRGVGSGRWFARRSF